MPEAPSRRFNLGDALVMIAATATGLALSRPALSTPITRIESSRFLVRVYATPVLVAWSVASLAFSLRQPRRLSHSLGRSPGFVMNTAAIAGVLCISMKMVGVLYTSMKHPWPSPSGPGRVDVRYMGLVGAELPAAVGYFVIGSLVALALFRRLRPRPIWTDRLGWTLGWVWVGMAILSFNWDSG